MLLSQSACMLGSSIFAASILPSAWASSPLMSRQATNISWFACPDNGKTQCAFFDVPRDYSNPTANDTVSIFMRKLSATVPAESRLGTILTNPGGPGNSGSGTIAMSEELSTIVEGRYDIIGFDPRGVNLTGPWTGCFDVEAKALHFEYKQALYGTPFPHTTTDIERAFVTRLSALQAGHNAACLKNGNRGMLESVGTASVARDMALIVEALGEDGLNFWGYSYGTILGATFAAMRPDLVKRMVLDGVSDAESYFDDVLQWGRDGMAETHKTLTGFLSTCAEAGPKHCEFAIPKIKSGKAETTESLRKRLNALYTRLDKEPITVADSPVGPGNGPGIFTASDLQAWVLGMLHAPKIWSFAAQVLVRLEQGDATAVYSSLYFVYSEIHSQPYTQNVYNRSMQIYPTSESFRSIFCGDTAPTNIPIKSYVNYFREMGKISPTGESWAIVAGICRGWSFRANQRYTGPWTTAGGLKKTRFPILFLSLDADPMTPLSSAVKMSRGFGKESASLLIQKGYGHCTTAHPSLCTVKNVRDYFLDGKVPANGTYCTPEPGFIYPTNNTSSKRSEGLIQSDDKLLSALHRLREAREKFSHPLGI
ncbi:alpha/beta-hydrolase [Ceratobasidium sp. AG-I]|nr:alpha/beta-hydrolase [Ceratobasidium sp. AG-I]